MMHAAASGAAPIVLIVEDEANILELSRMYFEQEGFQVVTARDGEQALAQVEARAPHLMLLDVMMPKLDGLTVCRRLRAAGNTIPIIVLTARDDDLDKILGLELGADDYVTKPFNPREVVARAKALLRRTGWYQQEIESSQEAEAWQAGDLRIEVPARQAWVGASVLTLRPREWELLLMLVRHRGEAMSRDQLLSEVWGYEYPGDSRTVDVHIAALRDKLRQAQSQQVSIETVWSIGYKLVVRDDTP